MGTYIDTPASGARWHLLTIQEGAISLELWSATGLFSKTRLDPGSRLLIVSAPCNDGQSVLDLGCGIGVVGIFLSRQHSLTVTYSDINPLATKVTRKNLEHLGLEGEVICTDAYARIKGQFDLILTNPPIVAGRKKIYDLIDGAPAHLVEGGRFCLVARHNKGGKMLATHMKEVFGNVVELDKKSGYRVYCSQKQ